MTLDKSRMGTLGGSDVAAALGLDPRKTPLDLWKEKLLGAEAIDGPALRRGKFLEPAVLRRHLKGEPAELQARIEADGWRSANIDALAGKVVKEVKTLSRRVFENDWGEPGTDDVPDRALCQTLWYADMANAERAEIVAAVLPDDPDRVLGLTADEVAAECDVHVYPIARNAAAEEAIRERAWKFWHVNVLTETPPERVDYADAAKLWRTHTAGKLVEADERLLDLLRKRDAIKEAEADAKAELERLNFALAEAIGDAEGLAIAGKPILTWKRQERDSYVVAPTAFRVFRTTKTWKQLKESLT